MRWVIVVLAALALLVACPSPANAQSIPSPPAGKPTPADEATARKNFESGLKLYGEGSFAEALIAFEQSYRLGGRPSALKNIAQCHRNLKHFVEAYDAYEQMLALHEAQLPAADKTAVRQALDELAVLTGTINVVVDQPDAEIEIDGKTAGRSPMGKPRRVKVDPHAVKVTKAGFDPFEQTVTVGSQEQKKVDVKLAVEKTSGHLIVREQSGREGRVFVDGQDEGPAPWEGDIEAGDHTIEIKGPRFTSEPRKIHLAQKERLDVALDATPLLGRLRVTTVPATATIRVDGKPVGTGAWEGELPEGTHRIEVAMGSEAPQVRDITLARGQLVVQEIPVVAAIAISTTDYNGVYAKFSLGVTFGVAGNASNAVSLPPGQGTLEDNGGFIGQSDAAIRIGNTWREIWSLEGVGIFMFEHRDRSYHYSGPPPTGTSTSGTTNVDFKDDSNMVNGFLGAGGRVTSKGETVRFTFSLTPGVSIRAFTPNRNCNGNCSNNGGNNPGSTGNPGSSNRFAQTSTSPSGGCGSGGPCGGGNNGVDLGKAGYTTLGFVSDGGVLFGSTPGAKFFLGVQAWLDFPPTIVVGPDNSGNTSSLPDSAYARPGRGVVLIDGPQFYFGPVIGLQFGH
jgi:hypothetical protein